MFWGVLKAAPRNWAREGWHVVSSHLKKRLYADRRTADGQTDALLFVSARPLPLAPFFEQTSGSSTPKAPGVPLCPSRSLSPQLDVAALAPFRQNFYDGRGEQKIANLTVLDLKRVRRERKKKWVKGRSACKRESSSSLLQLIAATLPLRLTPHFTILRRIVPFFS